MPFQSVESSSAFAGVMSDSMKVAFGVLICVKMDDEEDSEEIIDPFVGERRGDSGGDSISEVARYLVGL